MPIVDREHLAAQRARFEEAAKPFLDADGQVGALARANPLGTAMMAWMVAEIERGTAPIDLTVAMAKIAGNFIGTVLYASSDHPAAAVNAALALVRLSALSQCSIEPGEDERIAIRMGQIS